MRDDVKAAVKEYEISTTPFFKKNVEAAEKFLDPDESVILCLETNFVINYPDPTKKVAFPGIVFVTNKRIIIRYKPNKEEFVEIMQLGEISDIKPISFPAGGDHIQIYSPEKIYDFPILTKQKGLVISAVQSKQAAFGKVYRAFLFAKNPNGFEQAESDKAGKVSEQQPDTISQIEKLAELKDKGIISEEEFQQKKTELLSKI